MGQAESLQKALQQNPFCAQMCVDSSCHVSKQIQQEPAQGRNVLVENRQQNESCINYVADLRTMQQDQTAANPN